MMKVNDFRVQNFYEHLARINKIAYKNDYLITTDVLAKSPLCRVILPVLKTGKSAPSVSLLAVVKKIAFFYIKNTGWYLIQMCKQLVHFLSRQRYNIDQKKETLTLIDVLFYSRNIVDENNYNCMHFPGIEEVLKEQGESCAYTTKFFDTYNPFRLFKVFKILKHKRRPVLTEFQLLKLIDYLLALKFLFLYPVHILKLVKQLGKKPEDEFLKYAIFDTLGQPALLYYFQILYGRRISLLPLQKIKCISWYENQPRDKCFYRGMRFVKGKVMIYGAQLFVWPSSLRSIEPEIEEIEFGVVPDKILVNGKIYLPDESPINYSVGPSLRSKRIFQVKADPAKSNKILILMPYFEPEIEYFLKIINKLEIKQTLFLKFHPGVNQKKFITKIKKEVQVVQGDLFDFLEKSKMVIGMATSTLVEAASLGIPVISVENNEKGQTEFSHSFMPNMGKGIIWNNASNISEIEDRVRKFNELISREPEQIIKTGKKYKEIFFTDPSEIKIIDAFDLN